MQSGVFISFLILVMRGGFLYSIILSINVPLNHSRKENTIVIYEPAACPAVGGVVCKVLLSWR